MRLYLAQFKSRSDTSFGRWLMSSPSQFDQVVEDILRSYQLLIEPLSPLALLSLAGGETIHVETSEHQFYITVSPIDLDEEIVAI